jgi:hypothetical protein
MSKNTTFSKHPFSWEIEKVPTLYQNGKDYIPFPNRETLLNSVSKAPISIMSDHYHPFTNKRLIELAEKISEAFGISPEKYGTMGVGKKVIILFSAGEGVQINGRNINHHLAIGNSHDGSTGIFFTEKRHMIECDNIWYGKFNMLNIKHNINMNRLLAEAEKNFLSFKKMIIQEKEMLERYSQIEIAPELIKFASMNILGVKEEKMSTNAANKLLKLQNSMRIEMRETGYTAFGLFNGVTHYNTHEISEGFFDEGGFYLPTSVRAKNIERLHKYVESLV